MASAIDKSNALGKDELCYLPPMRHFIARLIICVSAFGSVYAQTEQYKKWIDSDESSLVAWGSYEFDGQNYPFKLYASDFEGTPVWNLKGLPPLSHESAANKAKIKFEKIVGPLKPWVVYKVSLRSVPDSAKLWYYLVEFRYTAPDRRGSTFGIFVRMDGSVIPPIPK
jgi:hypothetical protein